MGRCYEFGVAVQEGCEHAMVVSSEGGACICATCAATCTGRFGGCQAILAVPGRVPSDAPDWAVRRGSPPSPAGTPAHDQSPLAEPGHSAVPTGNGKADVHGVGPSVTKAAAADPNDDPELVGLLSQRVRSLSQRVSEQAQALDDLRNTVTALSSQLARRDAELRDTFERLNDSYGHLAKEMATLSRRMAELGRGLQAGPALRRLMRGSD